MRTAIEGDTESLREGWPRLLTISVENDGSDPILLASTAGGPRDGVQRWRQCVLGAVLYDAGRDRYRHLTVLNTRSTIPVDGGLIPPGSSRTFDLPTQALGVGSHTAQFTTTGWRIPSAELDGRVYLQPKGPMRSVPQFLPLAEVRANTPETGELFSSPAIVRATDLEPISATASIALEVAADADDPSSAALARAGATEVLDRCRRLRGAWVLRDEGGHVHLVRGEEHLRLSDGAVDPGVWRGLEAGLPFEPVLVRFFGEPANDLRAELPGCGGPQEQQSLEPSELLGLFAAVDAAGLRVRWGRHTAINDGLVVEGR